MATVVQPFKPIKRLRHEHKHLPYGRHCLFIGQTMSGKSTAAAHLFRPEITDSLYKTAHTILLMTGTHTDAAWQHLIKEDAKRDNKVILYTTFDEDALGQLHETLQGAKPPRKKPYAYVILDDFAQDLSSGTGTRVFNKLIFLGRHSNLFTFLLSQHFSRVPLSARGQFSCFWFSSSLSSRLLRTINKELDLVDRDEDFVRLMRDMQTEDRHNALFVNQNVQPSYYKNFETAIDLPR